MGLLKSLEEDRATRLRSLTYTEMGGTPPYVSHEIGHSTNELNARTDDLQRIVKMFRDEPGKKFLIHQGMLNASSTSGNILQKFLSGVREPAKVVGSTLAQVPVNGTGTHFVIGFGGKEYLKSGLLGSNSKAGALLQTIVNVTGVNLGQGVNGAGRALNGEAIIPELVAGSSNNGINIQNSQFVIGDKAIKESKFDRNSTSIDITKPLSRFPVLNKLKSLFDFRKGSSPENNNTSEVFDPIKKSLLQKDFRNEIKYGPSEDISGRLISDFPETLPPSADPLEDSRFGDLKVQENSTIYLGSEKRTIIKNRRPNTSPKITGNIKGSSDGNLFISQSNIPLFREKEVEGIPSGSYLGVDGRNEIKYKKNSTSGSIGLYNTGKEGWKPLVESSLIELGSNADYRAITGSRQITFTLKKQKVRKDSEEEQKISAIYTDSDPLVQAYKERTQKLKDAAPRAISSSSFDTLEPAIYGNNFESIIPFSFAILTPTKNPSTDLPEIISFPAYLDSLDDGFNSDWVDTKYIGRAEAFYTYQGWKRDLSFSFKVAALKRENLSVLYDRLNSLAGATAPSYDVAGKFMRGTLCAVTIGNYLSDQEGLISSVKFSWDKAYPWSTGKDTSGADETLIVPHILNVSVSFIPIHPYNVTVNSRFFANA